MSIRLGSGCLAIVLIVLGGAVIFLTAGLTSQGWLTFGLYSVAVLVLLGALHLHTRFKLVRWLVTLATDPDKVQQEAVKLAQRGMANEAVQTELQAIRLFEKAGPGRLVDLVKAHLWLARLFHAYEPNSPQAMEQVDQAMAVVRQPSWGDDGERRLQRANVHFTGGLILLDLGRDEAALTEFTEADVTLRGLPDEPAVLRGRASALEHMATILLRLDRPDEAARATSEAEEIRDRLG